MGSSEGKKVITFSDTCNLLSQYLKKKRSFAELSQCLEKKQNLSVLPKGTVDLLPMIEKSGQNPVGKCPDNVFSHGAGKHDFSEMKTEAKSAPLTIFYGGQVIVFNDFPADKASEILSLADRGSAARPSLGHYNYFPSIPPATVRPQSPAESAARFSKTVPPGIISQAALASDLPIARKNSLSRFLEKRRDRIIMNSPYQGRESGDAPPLKVAKTEESLLGLGPIQLH